MSEIMVSVAVTTYNHEKYIAQALDSILNQRVNFKYEIIIGEDSSTDSTRTIVEEYARKYPNIIKPILWDRNVGGKRNAFEVKCRCRGKYIAHLEGDDYWTDPDKLQTQVDFLELHPEYIAVVHKYELVDAQGNRLNKRNFAYYKNAGEYDIDNFMNSDVPSQLASFVIRNIYKDNIEKYKYYTLKDNTIQGDIKMTFFLTAQGKIYRMDKVMSAYRLVLSGGSNWTSNERRSPNFCNKLEQLSELEAYAKEEWGIDLYMKYQRMAYSARAILSVARFRNKDSLKEAIKVIKYEKKAISYFFSYVMQKYILRKI